MERQQISGDALEHQARELVNAEVPVTATQTERYARYADVLMRLVAEAAETEVVRPETEPVYIDVHSITIDAMWRDKGMVFRRRQEAVRGARLAEGTEVIKTVMPDGLLENVVLAYQGDIVVTGSQGEEYRLDEHSWPSVFERYPDGTWTPKERDIAVVRNPLGRPIVITPPWSTESNPQQQFGGPNCYLAVSLDYHDHALTTDRYIIADDPMLHGHYDRIAGDWESLEMNLLRPRPLSTEEWVQGRRELSRRHHQAYRERRRMSDL